VGLAMAEARRNQHKLAVVFIDLDHFKDVNDRMGHAAGDQLLVAIAARIKAAVREIDTVARIGGDEFAVALPRLESSDMAAHVVRRILAALQPEVCVDGVGLRATSSMGIALYPDHGADSPTLLERADRAMYRSKRSGRNAWHFWDENMPTDPDAPGSGNRAMAL
jgi:diguanylate cyclase (GGDEF)-like protein